MIIRRTASFFLPRTYATGLVLAGTAALSLALGGCGGGGGGTSGGNNSGTNNGTNPITSAPVAQTPSQPSSAPSRASLTVLWAARSRAVSAPASALSVVVSVGGQSLIMNRDAARLDAYSDTQNLPDALAAGSYPVSVVFYSQTNGAGSRVGAASRTVDVSGAAVDLGDFAVSGVIAGVEIAPKQSVSLGGSLDLAYTPVDASGAALASITPGSGFINIVSGQNALQVQNGRLVGLAPGLAQVTVIVDGAESAPQAVGVGQASVSLATIGTTSAVTLSNTITRSDTSTVSTLYGQASGRASVPFASGWFDRNQVSAPQGFGDQGFDHWEAGGQSVSTQPVFAFVPADNNGALGSGTLTAAYTTRTMPSGGFVPQFNQLDNVRWNVAKFPLRVFLADGSLQTRLARGFDGWVKATGGRISYVFVKDAANADISVGVGTTSSAGTSGEAAIAAVTYDTDTNEIMSGTITFTSDAAQLTDPRGDLFSVLSAHEFGHLLGLISETEQGHSPDALDTMYFKPNLSVGSVTERDVNSLENLYPTLFHGTGGGGVGRGAAIRTGKTATFRVH